MCQKMQRNRKPGLVLLASAVSLFALVSTQAMSLPAFNKRCNQNTIRGSYGIQMQGTRPASPGAIEQVIGVVMRNYDGRGGFEQTDNIKGSVTGITLDRPGSGSYEVNPDCTGSTSFQPDPDNPNIVIVEKFVIVDDGAEIRSIAASPPPLMITGVAKRVNRR